MRWDVYAKIKVLFTILDVRVNLYTFGFTIPVSTPTDPTHDLAAAVSNTLWLNIGAGTGTNGTHNAAARGYRSSNINETVYVGYNSETKQIVVSGFGGQHEEFPAAGITLIKGFAGTGNDKIIVSDQVLVPVEIHGGAGDDTLRSGGGPGALFGDAGKDLLLAGFGGGTFDGGDHDDTVFGGDGIDVIHGGLGNDRLFGRRRDDSIDGGDGIDAIDGGIGADTLAGGSNNDIIRGGVGDDTIRGDAGNDEIEGGDGSDKLRGGGGNDTIRGGLGNDFIWGEGGSDTIWGEQNNDVLFGGAGNDVLNGQGASDIVYGDNGPVGMVLRIFGVDGPLLADEGKDPTNQDVITADDGSDILLDGQHDSDTYLLIYNGGKANSRIIVLDTGSSVGTDIFTVTGTINSDNILLRANTDGASAFVALINDNQNAERIDYTGVERIVINGSFGDDHFISDDTAAEVTINGEEGNDTFQIGQIFRSARTSDLANIAIGDELATVETTRGFLSNGISRR